MKTVHWGTIGCGDVCERKAGPALYGVEGSELVAVMRRTRAKAEDFARRHNVPRFYDSIDELLADPEIDSVYVATPNDTHLEPVLAAVEAGKHILVEKPMARNTAACQEMIDACAALGLVLAVAYYRRCYPTILRAKQLIDSGELGAVKTLTINDEFPLSHRLDLFHFLCGDVVTVWAESEPLPPGHHAPEGAMLHVKDADGAEGIMSIGWEEKLAPETVDIVCENGQVHVTDLKKGTLTVVRDGTSADEDLGPLPATHWGLVENFVRHVNGEAPLACDGVEGRKSTVILDIVNELQPGSAPVTPDYS
ncbi:MAG: Gfo/Idh/MocA family protein [Phycisphaerae bacterium]